LRRTGTARRPPTQRWHAKNKDRANTRRAAYYWANRDDISTRNKMTWRVLRPELVAIKKNILEVLNDRRYTKRLRALYAIDLCTEEGLVREVVRWDSDVDHAIADAIEVAKM
jgi:hypothetical protein